MSQSNTDSIVRAIGKSGAILFAGTFLELVISLLAKLLVAQQLSRAGYGEVAFGLTVLTIGAIVARMGLDTGVARNASRYEGKEKRGILVSSFVLYFLLASVLTTVLFVGATGLSEFFGNPRLAPVLQVFALGIPAIPMMYISVSATQAEGYSGPKVVVQNFTRPVFRIILVVGVVLLGATPVEIAGAYVAANWISAGVGILFAARYTPILDFSLGWTPKYRELLRFSLPLMIATSMMFVIGYTDRLMLQYFISSEAVGVYDVGYTIGNTLSVMLGAFSFMFLPKVSELHAQSRWNEINHLYQLVTKWIVFATLPAFLIILVLPETTISLTFGAKYRDSALVLLVIATTYFLRAGFGPNQDLLAAAGDTRYVMVSNLTAAVMNVVLNIILIGIVSLGTLGAAIASFVSFTSLNALYSGQLYQKYDILPFSRSLLRPLAGFATFGILVWLLLSFVSRNIGTSDKVVLLFALGITFPVFILALNGVQSDDIMLINSVEEQSGISLEPVKRIARWLM